MFDQIVGEKSARARRPFAVVLSFAGQVVVISLTVLFPMMRTAALVPNRLLRIALPHAETPPTHAPPAAHTAVRSGPHVFVDRVFREPSRVPDKIVDGSAAAEIEFAPEGPAAYGVPDGVIGAPAIEVMQLPKLAPPKAAAPVATAKTRPLPVGGDVQAAKLIRQLKPVYPPLAKQARISGTVRLEAVIGASGVIENLRVISGHPLLVPAAVEAVRQWVYRPTLLNSVAVEVLTQIEVNFKLD